MSKNLSAKYYQETKERLWKKLVKDIKIFLKKRKKKSSNMVVNVTKVSQKIKKRKVIKIKTKIRKYSRITKNGYNN